MSDMNDTVDGNAKSIFVENGGFGKHPMILDGLKTIQNWWRRISQPSTNFMIEWDAMGI